MTEVQLYFVLPNGADTEDDCDNEMQQAYNQCEQHRASGIAAEWITEDQCTSKANLTKRDVFILQDFKGALFNKLLKTKAVIVGARCLSCCLTEGSQIPPGPHPVYTVAMRGLIITTTGLDKEQKENIRKKVLWMGGTYDNVLTVQTTHLISNTIFSDKYNNAVATKIPIFHKDWIEAVWEASLKQNVSAADSQFDKHRLPTFYGAIMTTSGFSKQEKKKIVNLINENGGTFKGDFESIATDVVIMNSESVGGSKYKAAVEYDKYCVLPSWIYESVAKGCALNPDNFKVYENKTSSPYSNGKLPDMSLNLSTITNLRNPVAPSVDETCSSTVSSDSSKLVLGNNTKDVTCSQRGRPSRICPVAKELGLMVDSIEMKDVKLAGPFLDGCCIYVYGTSATRRDKVHRIISRCGGVRYDSPHASVTHILSGDPGGPGPGPAERSAMPRAAHLSLRWLLDSLKARKQLEENQYLVSGSDKSDKGSTPGVTTAACASPMSKRNLQLLQPARPPVPLFNLDRDNEQEKDEIVQQYMNHSKMPVGDSEDALAEYFKQGGGSFKDQNATVTAVKNVGDASANDVTVTTTLRVMMGDDKKTLVDAPSQSNEASCHPEASTITEMTEDLSEIFNGITFELQGMEETTAAEVAVNIEASGGTVLPVGHGAEFVVVPLDYDEAEVVSKDSKIVTTFWLDDCLSQEEIVGVEYYHKPVKVMVNVSPLSEQILGISTYVGVERAFIDELAQLLGAKTQVTFCRRTTETSRASTHLICPEAKGDKYRGAVKWGLPAVTSHWLLACATQGRRVREGPFLIGDTKEPIWKEEDISVLAETANGEGEKTCADFNKENVSIKETTVSATVPPTKLLDDNTSVEKLDDNDMTRAEDILMRERLSDDAYSGMNVDRPDNTSVNSDSAAALPLKISTGVLSENTPKGKAKLSLGVSTEMSPASRFIALARQGLLGSDSQETPKRVMEICKDFRQQNESVSTPPMDNALATPNLALFSPTSRRRLQAIKRGEMPSDPPKTPRNPFETSVATPDSPFGAALRPQTGHMSVESKKKLWKFCEQLPTPNSKNEPKETSISELSKKFFSRYQNSGGDTTPLAPRQLRTSDTEETPPAKQRKINEGQTPATPEQSTLNSDLQMDVHNSLKRLTSIMASGSSSAAKTPRLAPIRSTTDATKPSVDVPGEHLDAAAVPSSCSESQAYTVGWDDTAQAVLDKVKTPEKCKVYKFILSQNVNNRTELVAIINRLGGSVTEGTELDLSVTHMLYSRPAKSEKIMASIAAGIWLLHPAYIPSCAEAGRFISEDAYEWGNTSSNILPPLDNPVEEHVAAAGRRWRLARSGSGASPFSGMRVLLHVLPARRPPLLRLIVSGGGAVLDVSPPYTKEVNATHCIVELQRMSLSDDDQEYLLSRKIPLCPPTFIGKLLIEEPAADAMAYAYPTYRKLMRERFGES